MDFEFLEEFGKAFVPKKTRPTLGAYLEKAGIDDSPYKFFGILFFLTTIITYFIYLGYIYNFIRQITSNLLIFFISTFISWFGTQIIIVSVVMLGISFYLNIKIYQRTKLMEDLLPEYLSLVSTNLRGGMSFEKSLWSAIKSDFGVLAKEIGIVSKKVATGNDVSDALNEFAKKYESPILRRSIDLIKSELSSGGKVADVIDQLVTNLRRTKELKKEMAATGLSYMIFMGAIVLIITPGLFALSKQLLIIMIGLGTKIGNTVQPGAAIFTFSPPDIKTEDFTVFSIFAIGIIAVFTSIIISIIERGSIKAGLKYIPLFLFTTIFLYLILSKILQIVMTTVIVIN